MAAWRCTMVFQLFQAPEIEEDSERTPTARFPFPTERMPCRNGPARNHVLPRVQIDPCHPLA